MIWNTFVHFEESTLESIGSIESTGPKESIGSIEFIRSIGSI